MTDGFFSQAKRKAIIQEINYCISKNLLVIGIGLGIYPLGIEKLFPYIVYSKEPIQVIDAIAACFSDTKNSNSNLEIIEQIFPEKIFMKNEIFQNFKTYEPKNDIIDFLRKIPIFLNSYSFYVGERDDRNDDGNLQTVQSLIKHAIYPENFLEGKKVLIAMFYSAEMNPKENLYLSYNFIKNPQFGQYYCLKNSLEYLGIIVEHSISYIDAINKLNYDKDGYCEYYACIILSGLPYPDLPISEEKGEENPNLVGEFVKTIIEFWKKGGGLGIFDDNAPFTFHANLILEQLFDKNIRFRIGGFHEGKKLLKGIQSWILEENGTFNRNIHYKNSFEMPLITHNLYQIYEDNTVGYIIENPKKDEILYFEKNGHLFLFLFP